MRYQRGRRLGNQLLVNSPIRVSQRLIARYERAANSKACPTFSWTTGGGLALGDKLDGPLKFTLGNVGGHRHHREVSS